MRDNRLVYISCCRHSHLLLMLLLLLITATALLIIICRIIEELKSSLMHSLRRILVLKLLQGVLLAYEHAISDIVGDHHLVNARIISIWCQWSLNSIIVNDDQIGGLNTAWIATVIVTSFCNSSRMLECALTALTFSTISMPVLWVRWLLLLLM